MLNKTSIQFGILIGTIMLLSFIRSTWILTDEVYYYGLSDKFTQEKVEQILKQREEFAWVGYIFIPVYYSLKIFLIGACIYIGVFLARIEIPFSALIGVAIKSEFVFVIYSAIELFWFGLIDTSYTLSEVKEFNPLTLGALFEPGTLEPWLVYPLRVLGVFEVLYFAMLSYQLSKALKLDWQRSFAMACKTYGVGLTLWVTFVIFLVVNLS